VYRDGIPVIAGHGFMEAAVSENVYAGQAMSRRSDFMYGAKLAKGPAGQISAGLGQTNSTGTVGVIPPTLEITETGQVEVIDGVRIRFQMTPGTECPVEMNFVFPERRALCMAENATHNLHNILTLRGAVVRDARIWSHYLNEAIELFADDVDVAFASHHWPTWGRDRIVKYLSEQRDLYAYLHDQTLRLMNQGYTGIEIAEMVELPPALDAAWHTHGYYGSASHNIKAIYQRYLGWFDGNPANLWQHPPEAVASRYVDAFGGADVVIDKAQGFIDGGDLRFAAELLNHVVFADTSNTAARELLAGVYDRLGYGSENGTWRNFYLQGAYELRNHETPTPLDLAPADVIATLTVGQLFDTVAIRVNGPKAWDVRASIDWVVTDEDVRHRTELTNGVLIQRDDPAGGADLTVTLTKSQLIGLLGGALTLADVDTDGDVGIVQTFLDVLDPGDPGFPIVTP
jgi:alkyl sulfatase BDS1-like metallo-beta-lactamase superfamily hydrolase